MKPFKRVFNFSGGRTSAYMVIHYYQHGDIVLFTDTGREHQKTYKFINDFEAHEGIPVTRLQYKGGWENFLSNWNKGKNIPNRQMRECTQELKIKTARRYLRTLGLLRYENFIGFRADEIKRVKNHTEKWKKVTTRFPLYEDGIRKPQIVEYFSTKPYDLEIPHILGNCDACFMKGEDKLIAIFTNDITIADKWIKDEEQPSNLFKHQYLPNHTMRQLRDIAQDFINKGKIFNLENMTAKFSCSCTA